VDAAAILLRWEFHNMIAKMAITMFVTYLVS